MSRVSDNSNEVLAERAKELECLYEINEALAGADLPDVLQKISEIIPLGFRDIHKCTADIYFDGQHYFTRQPTENCDELQTDIIINDYVRGYIKVMYPKGTFQDKEAFLPQEARMLKTISNIISNSVYKKNQTHDFHPGTEWESIIELLRNTDNEMLLLVCEKMLAVLAKVSPELLVRIFDEMNWSEYRKQGEINSPLGALPKIDVVHLSHVLFSSVAGCLSNKQIYEYICLWIYQKKTSDLVKIVSKKNSDIRSIIKAIQQYKNAVERNKMSSEPTKRWLTVELIRRFITQRPEAITNIQKYIDIDAFCELLENFICSPMSSGTIGGKATGFFIANQIIKSNADNNPLLKNIKIPRTWYISSDELANLIELNRFDELNEHKYRDILDIRINYPRIIQMLKSSRLSPYIVNQLDQILDECDGKPLIIRSSSMLEDQFNSSFSGKYKSLFITNAGTKAERREQLMDGILEVYASMFNPDSIQYRKQRNLIDCIEQMGIMIQEVVGRRVGPYFFPLYAGVAFSNNELRWSPRIRREDGLLRMVMGLGTRAVDRIGEDYPILVSPGQPNLEVNHSPEEIRKYSPRMIDVIDMEKGHFATLPMSELIKSYGAKIPHIVKVASVFKNDILVDANTITTDFKSEEIVITFNGLIRNTDFVRQVKAVLSLLSETLGYPVDIEFASDGESFYLLQCRSQSVNYNNVPAAIPSGIQSCDTVFTANKYVSNGRVTGIKSVVYVDPVEYSRLEKYEDFISVANAIGELNRMLPRRSFILMGPGRWGSRGDVKLGVPIAYSDINNTAMLIEIAHRESRHQPELSFGTHFFQDLVEENIKYLPLYPEDGEIIFNHSFFRSPNALSNILPSYSHLGDVVKVIQVEENFFGKQLFVLMNADLEKAIAYIDKPVNPDIEEDLKQIVYKETGDEDWKWRHFMAERIAEKIDMDRCSVKGIYLFGSTNNCTAKLNSDIDLLIHFDGTPEQKQELDRWLDGWSLALSEINFLRTGHQSNGLLDVHYVTDEDIKNRSSFAINIGLPYNPAFPLRVKNDQPESEDGI